MNVREASREQLLESLSREVADAAAFFATTSPILSDGRQTAHGILAQLVFWHERYVEVLSALRDSQTPVLIEGTIDSLNASARHRFAREPMVTLAQRFSELQHELDALLRALPDWSVNFPVKRDSGFCNVDERVRLIEEHVHNRVAIMKRAARP